MSSKLQPLWIDEQGGLTAKRKDGRSMPLYNATEVDVRIAELETALRLHLAVGPDDPILVEPVEKEHAALRADVEGLKAELVASQLRWDAEHESVLGCAEKVADLAARLAAMQRELAQEAG